MKNIFKLITIAIICFMANIAYSQATLKLVAYAPNGVYTGQFVYELLDKDNIVQLKSTNTYSSQSAALSAKDTLIYQIQNHIHSDYCDSDNNSLGIDERFIMIGYGQNRLMSNALNCNPKNLNQLVDWFGQSPTSVTYDGSEDSGTDESDPDDRSTYGKIEIGGLLKLVMKANGIGKFELYSNKTGLKIGETAELPNPESARPKLYDDIKFIKNHTTVKGSATNYTIQFKSGAFTLSIPKTKSTTTAELMSDLGTAPIKLDYVKTLPTITAGYLHLKIDDDTREYYYELYDKNYNSIGLSNLMPREYWWNQKTDMLNLIKNHTYTNGLNGFIQFGNDTKKIQVKVPAGKTVAQFFASNLLPATCNIEFIEEPDKINLIDKWGILKLVEVTKNNWRYELHPKSSLSWSSPNAKMTSNVTTKAACLSAKVKLMDDIANCKNYTLENSAGVAYNIVFKSGTITMKWSIPNGENAATNVAGYIGKQKSTLDFVAIPFGISQASLYLRHLNKTGKWYYEVHGKEGNVVGFSNEGTKAQLQAAKTGIIGKLSKMLYDSISPSEIANELCFGSNGIYIGVSFQLDVSTPAKAKIALEQYFGKANIAVSYREEPTTSTATLIRNQYTDGSYFWTVKNKYGEVFMKSYAVNKVSELTKFESVAKASLTNHVIDNEGNNFIVVALHNFDDNGEQDAVYFDPYLPAGKNGKEFLNDHLGPIATTVKFEINNKPVPLFISGEGERVNVPKKLVELALVEVDKVKKLWQYQIWVNKLPILAGKSYNPVFASQILTKSILLEQKNFLYSKIKEHVFTNTVSSGGNYKIYNVRFTSAGVHLDGVVTEAGATAETALSSVIGEKTQEIVFVEKEMTVQLDYSVLMLEQEKKNVNKWQYKLYNSKNTLIASSALLTKEVCEAQKVNIIKTLNDRIYKKVKSATNGDTIVTFTSGSIILKWEIKSDVQMFSIKQALDYHLTKKTGYSTILKDAKGTLTLQKEPNSNNYYYEIKDRFGEVVGKSASGTKANLLLHKVKITKNLANQTWESVTYNGFAPNDKMNIVWYGTKANSIECKTSNIQLLPNYPNLPEEWLSYHFGEKPSVITYVQQSEIDEKIVGLPTNLKLTAMPIVTNFVIKTEGNSNDVVNIGFKPFGNSFIVESKSSGFKQEYNLDNKADTTLELPKGKSDWKIYCLDSDNKMTIASQFSTATAERDNGVQVSRKLFNDISGYLRKTNGQTLYQFVANKQDISYYEKLNFVQRYFLKDKPLPMTFITTQTLPTEAQAKIIQPNEDRGADECNCEFLVTTTESVTKGEVEDCGMIKPQQDNVKMMGSNDQTVINGAMESIGSAKKMYLYAQGKRASGIKGVWDLSESDELVNEGVTPTAEKKTAYGSQLAYNYLCTNQDYLPDACAECFKTVNVWAKYETKITATAKTESCFLCGNKGASVKTEDCAFVTVASPFTDTLPKIISLGRAGAISECNVSINKDFAMAAVDFAGTVSSAVLVYISAGIVDTTGVTPLASVAATIPAITAGINAMITAGTPSVGTCAEGPKVVNKVLVDKKFPVKLLPNSPTYIDLWSASRIESGGYTSFTSGGYITSNSLLVGVVDKKVPNNTVEAQKCCSPRFANWVVCNPPYSPTATKTIFQNISNYINLFGLKPKVAVDKEVGIFETDDTCQ